MKYTIDPSHDEFLCAIMMIPAMMVTVYAVWFILAWVFDINLGLIFVLSGLPLSVFLFFLLIIKPSNANHDTKKDKV